MDSRLVPSARGERESERRSELIDSVIEKPIDKIRYPNVAKKTRRLMILATVEFVALIVVLVAVEKLMPLDAGPHHAILASVFSLLGIINIVAVCRAAKKDVRCCHCNSPIPLDSLKWHLIVSGLLPVCNKCRVIVGAEFIKPLPANSGPKPQVALYAPSRRAKLGAESSLDGSNRIEKGASA